MLMRKKKCDLSYSRLPPPIDESPIKSLVPISTFQFLRRESKLVPTFPTTVIREVPRKYKVGFSTEESKWVDPEFIDRA